VQHSGWELCAARHTFFDFSCMELKENDSRPEDTNGKNAVIFALCV
jgi:hypothetical protein